jgi:hypothetical protein
MSCWSHLDTACGISDDMLQQPECAAVTDYTMFSGAKMDKFGAGTTFTQRGSKRGADWQPSQPWTRQMEMHSTLVHVYRAGRGRVCRHGHGRGRGRSRTWKRRSCPVRTIYSITSTSSLLATRQPHYSRFYQPGAILILRLTIQCC